MRMHMPYTFITIIPGWKDVSVHVLAGQSIESCFMWLYIHIDIMTSNFTCFFILLDAFIHCTMFCLNQTISMYFFSLDNLILMYFYSWKGPVWRNYKWRNKNVIKIDLVCFPSYIALLLCVILCLCCIIACITGSMFMNWVLSFTSFTACLWSSSWWWASYVHMYVIGMHHECFIAVDASFYTVVCVFTFIASMEQMKWEFLEPSKAPLRKKTWLWDSRIQCIISCVHWYQIRFVEHTNTVHRSWPFNNDVWSGQSRSQNGSWVVECGVWLSELKYRNHESINFSCTSTGYVSCWVFSPWKPRF